MFNRLRDTVVNLIITRISDYINYYIDEMKEKVFSYEKHEGKGYSSSSRIGMCSIKCNSNFCICK